MISLIICSRDATVLQAVSVNVDATIGVPYELIAIDNSQGQYGICSAYNLGASQAKHELLCFMHEDICFHTSNWGAIVAATLEDLSVGVLGVAGGIYQANAPTSWIGAGKSCIRMNVLHSPIKGSAKLDYHNPNAEMVAPVAVVDGLWMCCRKEVWKAFPFDEKSFPHFHFYDVDFCTKIFTKYKILVTFQVLIEHFSTGTFEKQWTENALKYYKIRKNYLPFGIGKISGSEAKNIDLKAFQQAMHKLISHKAHLLDIVYCLYKCLLINPWNRDTMWIAKQYFRK